MNYAGVTIYGTYLNVKNNYIHDGDNTCEAIRGPHKIHMSNHINVTGNRIYKVAYGIIILGNNWHVENNEIERIYRPIAAGDADYMRVFGDSITIKGNYYHGTDRTECPDAHIDGIQTFDNGGEWARNITVEQNVFSDCDQGMMCSEQLTDTSMFNFTVRNNIFVNCIAFAISNYGIRNMNIYNNLFKDAKTHGVVFGWGAYGHIKNNIFHNVTNSYFENDDSSKVYGGYNVIFKSKVMNVDQADIVNQDPKIETNTNHNFIKYKIDTNSVCKESGIDVGVKYDIFGTERSTTKFDIGPFGISEFIYNVPSPFGIRILSMK